MACLSDTKRLNAILTLVLDGENGLRFRLRLVPSGSEAAAATTGSGLPEINIKVIVSLYWTQNSSKSS